jgi:uncharacterized membrane protein YedE/YeeE
MKLLISTFIAGILFGIGLAMSEMVDPARVSGFLDIAGAWDPTLLLVMGGALAVTLPAFTLIQKRERPLFIDKFSLPTKNDLDWKLISGAVLFGIGWGISGFCPGPALSALVTGMPEVIYFVLAMASGQLLAMLFERRRKS